MLPQGIRISENIYFYHGLYYHFSVELEGLENVCLYDDVQKLALIYPKEERNRDLKSFFNFSKALKKDKVFYREGLVYKFCDKKEEFDQNMDFFNRNRRVTLQVVFRDSRNLVIITKYVEYTTVFELLKSDNPPNLRKELVMALSNFDSFSFRSDLVNRKNVGYNGKDLIFYEETGKLIGTFDDSVEFIQAVFKYIKESEPKFYKLIKKDDRRDPPFIERDEILGTRDNPIEISSKINIL